MLFHEDADEQAGLLGGLWQCRSHKKQFSGLSSYSRFYCHGALGKESNLYSAFWTYWSVGALVRYSTENRSSSTLLIFCL